MKFKWYQMLKSTMRKYHMLNFIGKWCNRITVANVDRSGFCINKVLTNSCRYIWLHPLQHFLLLHPLQHFLLFAILNLPLCLICTKDLCAEISLRHLCHATHIDKLGYVETAEWLVGVHTRTLSLEQQNPCHMPRWCVDHQIYYDVLQSTLEENKLMGKPCQVFKAVVFH